MLGKWSTSATNFVSFKRSCISNPISVPRYTVYWRVRLIKPFMKCTRVTHAVITWEARISPENNKGMLLLAHHYEGCNGIWQMLRHLSKNAAGPTTTCHEMSPVVSTILFAMWGIDLVGQFPKPL
ncbi:hypothetical protein LIER_37720 [Lithospermum erythrorhizon]|uniref:Uncharacterized protein n=1 Tax=Lithospermum erythrorhizon TaxID=34254 RepID=A0AAV3PUP7_LITER